MADVQAAVATDPLEIAGQELSSRLFLGTGGFRSLDALSAALEASATAVTTVALRRIEPSQRGSLIDVLDRAGVRVLPNTAGCYTARDAVTTAQLAREAFETDWIKLEVIGDDRTLLPDAPELLAAAEQLVADDFVVLPYTTNDPIVAARLRGPRLRGGHAARVADRLGDGDPRPVQPRASSSSARKCRSCSTPAWARPLMPPWRWSWAATRSCCASAVSRAEDPVAMAEAIRGAVEAGRLARRAGRIPRRRYAEASTTHEGLADL